MRFKGEGTYYRDGDYWCWKRRTGSGKSQRTIVIKELDFGRFKTRVKEAKDKIDAARGQVSGKRKERLWKVIFLEWLETFVKPVREIRTYESYEGMVRTVLIPAIGDVKESKLDSIAVQKMINKMQSAKVKRKDGTEEPRYSPRTIRYAVAILVRCANKMKKRLMIADIVEDLTLPEDGPQRKRVLRSNEAEAVHELMSKPGPKNGKAWRYEPVVTFLANTGPRVSEALGLLVLDLDLKAKTVTFSKQLQWYKDDEGYRCWRLKSLKGRKDFAIRTVALNDDAYAAVLRQLDQVKRDKEAAGKGYDDHGLLFATESGKPIDRRNLKRTLDSVAEHLGIESVWVHDLRRTFGTHLAKNEPRQHIVGAALGHAPGSKATFQHYVWADQELQDQATKTLQIRPSKTPEQKKENEA